MKKLVTAAIAILFAGTAYAGDTVSVPVLEAPPKAGDLGYKYLVLVRATPDEARACNEEYQKGSAGPWYHGHIGGNTKSGVPRLSATCILVGDNAVILNRGRWRQSSEGGAALASAAPRPPAPKPVSQPRILDREPGKGELGSGETVLVRSSDRIQCGSGLLVKVTGAKDANSRRTRVCVKL